MPLSYAGVPLAVPTAEDVEWCSANLRLIDVMQAPAEAPANAVPDEAVAVGTLYWPTGASRWARGLFIVTEAQLAAIRASVNAGGYHAAPLSIGDGTRAIGPSMYMLPALPLNHLPGQPGRYLLPLVDERYWWWYETTENLVVTTNVTTWAGLYASIAAELGITLTVDAINSAYLNPASGLTSRYLACPPLLDAVAMSLGHQIVVPLGSATTASAQHVLTAIATQTAQLAKVRPVNAGGLLDLTPGVRSDLAAKLPQKFQIAFARQDDGILGANRYAVSAAFSSLTIPQLAGAKTAPFTRTVRNQALAVFASGVLQNGAALQALVNQTATDYYLDLASRVFLKFSGVADWQPEGLTDHIIWTYREEEVSTWVVPRPDDNDNVQLYHATAAPGGSADQYALNITQINSPVHFTQEVFFNNTFNWTNSNQISITGTVNNYSLTNHIHVNFNPTSNTTITGFVATQDGDVRIIANSSTTNWILISHKNSSSSTLNQIFTWTQGDQYILPGNSVQMIYRADLGLWFVLSQCTPYPVYTSKTSVITTSQNNFPVSPWPVINLQVNAPVNLTGVSPPSLIATSFPFYIFYNSGNSALTITHEDGSSLASNRFNLSTGTNITVPALSSVQCVYDTNISRWRDVASSIQAGISNAGSGGGGGTGAGSGDVHSFIQTGTSPLEIWYAGGVMIGDGNTTALVMSANTIYWAPFWTPTGGTVDRIGYVIGLAGSAGAKLRVGIYDTASSTNTVPNNLLFDAGEDDGTVIGVHSHTVTGVTLTAGKLYWLAALSNGLSINFDGFNQNVCFPVFGYGPTLSNSNAARCTGTSSQTYGALPSVAPTITPDATSAIPNIALRFSSVGTGGGGGTTAPVVADGGKFASWLGYY